MKKAHMEFDCPKKKERIMMRRNHRLTSPALQEEASGRC